MRISFAERMKGMKGTSVRNKLFDDPMLISFAAGKPEGKLFPADELIPSVIEILQRDYQEALQYSDTEGIPDLRSLIAEQRMREAGVRTTADRITLTSGSQEGIEMSAKILVNPGDVIICENPSYVGAYSAFEAYQPSYVGISLDEDGMKMDELEQALKAHPEAKMIYTIPDFQNPTGIVMSDERRRRLAQLAAEYEIPVIEDCPYGDLYYDGDRHPAVKSFDEEGWVIMLGSFSKIFCPGFRIGWVCAEPQILEKYILCKQSSNLQCSTLDEKIAAEYMRKFDLNTHIEEVRAVYRGRRDRMLECIEKYLPSGVRYTKPHGGFFVWLELKEEIDGGELLIEAAREAKVGFVQGGGFFTGPGHENYIRLSYSFVDEEQIEEGMRRLGLLLKKYY